MHGIIGMAVEGRAGTIQISDSRSQTSGCVSWRRWRGLAGTLGGLQIGDCRRISVAASRDETIRHRDMRDERGVQNGGKEKAGDFK